MLVNNKFINWMVKRGEGGGGKVSLVRLVLTGIGMSPDEVVQQTIVSLNIVYGIFDIFCC